jgi:hypothetical protein
MSNQPENKSEKLNKLNLNKETITDLDTPNAQDVKGGALSILPGTCHVCEAMSVRNCPTKDLKN